jgi:hypothetical protein
MAKARSGISTKVIGDVIHRFTAVKALWFVVNNDPEYSVQDLAPEFYFAVGSLLEGIPIEQVSLYKINKERVLQYIKEG